MKVTRLASLWILAAVASAATAAALPRDQAVSVDCLAAMPLPQLPVVGGEVMAFTSLGSDGVLDVAGGASDWGTLRESLGVAEVRVTFAQLPGVTELVADPLVAPLDFWICGPLGELREQANAAAAMGDEAAFHELAGRYWTLFHIAVERRRVLGTGTEK